VEETEQIMDRIQFGLKPKIHVNQFNSIGGIQAGVKYKALSVDHLEIMKPEDIDVKKYGDNACYLLALIFLFPYTPAREMIAAGLH
jgi:imidazolonepropionase